MAARLIERFDGWVGHAIEAAIRSHHQRRLRAIGRAEQLDPPGTGRWAAGEPPPRSGCELEVLLDGAQALPRIAEALAGARSHVHVAGWHLAPHFRLTREHDALSVREQLAQLAQRVDVRALLWAGAPLPLFSPDRREARAAREALVRGTRIRAALDSHERPLHCHHEKLVIVDDEIAFVGGIDLTDLGGDRFDSHQHPARGRLGWHDAASRLRGPAVGDVAAHFAARWREATGERLASAQPQPCGELEVQVVRTVPEKIYDFLPRGDFRILESYVRALRAARELVYIESQFLWSVQVVELLAAKLRDPPSDAFRIVVVLPAKPNNGADTTRGQLGALIDADGGQGRFLAATISARSGERTEPAYVHAKIGIVDDEWLTIGSANLNEHSFFNDTEMNVVVCDRALARGTRVRLWAEHLELPPAEVGGEPRRLIDELWRPIAEEQLERVRRGAPRTHRLLKLPGVSRRSQALLGPLDSLLVDG